MMSCHKGNEVTKYLRSLFYNTMTMVNIFMAYFDLHADNMILNIIIYHILCPNIGGHLGSSSFHH